MADAGWIAADWGTSRLRLWALDSDDRVLAEATSEQGMGQLAPGDFEAVFVALAAPFLPQGRVTRALICGMAGARQGWAEAPYTATPCAAISAQMLTVPTTDPRLDVRILPGLCQTTPPDVIRGEETQIAGFLTRQPGHSGTLCLPGTHSKWVRLTGGQVAAFRTAMTGELFDLLRNHSVLRHSLGERWDDAAFIAAVTDACDTPAAALAELFTLRAQSLVAGAGMEAPLARLSGLLIGAELAAMRDHWHGAPVTVIGTAALAARYTAALRALGVEATQEDGEDLALVGLIAAHALLIEVEE